MQNRRRMFSMAALGAFLASMAAKAQTKIVPVQMSVQIPVMAKYAATRNTDGKVWTATVPGGGTLTYTQVFWNGLLQDEGVDYNRAGNVITFISTDATRDAALALPTSIVQIHGHA